MAMKGGYYKSWSGTSFPLTSIKTQYFTHIYYAFLNPNTNTFNFDDISPTDVELIKSFNETLHAASSPVRTLFSIGGDGKSDFFAPITYNQDSRANFIKACINVAKVYGFDGIDFDWEFPKTSQEMDNFGYLLKELHAVVQKEAGTPLVLSAAVYYDTNIHWLSVSYPVSLMVENLDWINIMTYDYCVSLEDATKGIAYPAALYGSCKQKYSDYGILKWIKGVPTNKLVMGLPLYGITWKLENTANHEKGAAASGLGPNNGVMTYAEVMSFNKNNNAAGVYDSKYVAAHSWAVTTWIGYDDTTTVKEKVRYLNEKGLHGYFFWSVDMDDDNWTISNTAFRS